MFKKSPDRLTKRKEQRLLTFILGLVTAAAFFVPFIIKGDGYFIFFGDFNVQQIPFYQHCHELVRSGEFWGWDWQTDLGANFIGSYSFYLLGSPFFWLTIPFPNWFVPYLMGPLLILKFACAALTAYLFIRRFTATPSAATVGGLLYAFSGFSVYNIFFNHFHEAIIVFPLLLLAMEQFLAEKKRGVLILAVFLSALTNYFFFFGMVVFVIIYWAVRMLSKSFKFKLSEFFLMLFECILGLTLAAAILLPTVLEVLQNDRLSSVMSGWGAVLFGKEQIFLNVIQCFFFPPDLPARPVFFPGAEVRWSSLGGWLPLLGMTGTIAMLKAEKKGTWLRRILVISIFMALVPGLNAVFSLLNTAYYARWFFMPILLMCMGTAIALEDTEVDWNSAWRWSAGITLAFTVVIGFLPTVDSNTGEITKWGLYTDSATNPFKYIYQTILHAIDGQTHVDGDFYDMRFWISCAFALGSCIAVRLLIPIIKEKKSSMFKPIIALICVVSVMYSAYFIYCGQQHSYEMDSVMTDQLIEGEVSIAEQEEGKFSRIDVYDGVDNTGLYLNMSSINFFHSIVPSSIVDFYEYVGISRGVGSRPETTYRSLRPLLSVEYLLDPDIENSKEFTDSDGKTAMPDYTLYSTESGYDIYRNNSYIPMGFTYDYYISYKDMEEFSGERRVAVMLKAMLVKIEDIPEIEKYLKNIDTEYIVGENNTGIKPIITTDEAVKADCEARAAVSAHKFETSSKGFTAHISMDRDNLVFFSVPYHEGWTATVNGQKAEIFRVNEGFMAVVAPEGVCEIEFTFETPGLKLGLIIAIITLAVSVIYLCIVFIKRKYKPVPPTEYPEGEVTAERIRRFEGANYAAENPDDDYLLDNLDKTGDSPYAGIKGGFTIDDTAVSELSGSGEVPFTVDDLADGLTDLPSYEPQAVQLPTDSKADGNTPDSSAKASDIPCEPKNSEDDSGNGDSDSNQNGVDPKD